MQMTDLADIAKEQLRLHHFCGLIAGQPDEMLGLATRLGTEVFDFGLAFLGRGTPFASSSSSSCRNGCEFESVNAYPVRNGQNAEPFDFFPVIIWGISAS